MREYCQPLPSGGQGSRREVELHLVGRPGKAAGAVSVANVDDDLIGAGHQHALRDWVDSLRRPVVGAADGHAIDPRLVHVVEHAERECCALRRLRCGQREAARETRPRPSKFFHSGPQASQ